MQKLKKNGTLFVVIFLVITLLGGLLAGILRLSSYEEEEKNKVVLEDFGVKKEYRPVGGIYTNSAFTVNFENNSKTSYDLAGNNESLMEIVDGVTNDYFHIEVNPDAAGGPRIGQGISKSELQPLNMDDVNYYEPSALICFNRVVIEVDIRVVSCGNISLSGNNFLRIDTGSLYGANYVTSQIDLIKSRIDGCYTVSNVISKDASSLLFKYNEWYNFRLEIFSFREELVEGIGSGLFYVNGELCGKLTDLKTDFVSAESTTSSIVPRIGVENLVVDIDNYFVARQ